MFHLMIEKSCSNRFPSLHLSFLTPTVHFFYAHCVFSVLLASGAALTEWKSDIIADQNSGSVLAIGIILNHVTEVLLAEKFINVDFLVPFPKFVMNVSANLGAFNEKLGRL